MEHELETACDEGPRELLEQAVERLRAAADAEVALCYIAVRRDPQTLHAADWTVAGVGPRAKRVRESFERGFKVSSISAMVPTSWELRFVRFEEVLRRMPMASAKLEQEVTGPTGVIDQLVLPVSDQGRYVGPMVALRFEGEQPFDARVASQLRGLVAPLSSTFATASRVLRARCPVEACDLTVDPSGRVEYASLAAAPWLEHRDVRDELSRVVRRVDKGRHPGFEVPFRGAQARVVRLERDQHVLYAVRLSPPGRLVVRRCLTEAQRDVGLLAAAGATAGEIATIRGTAAGTIRNQLKDIYAVLGVTTRVELAQALSQ